MTDRQVASKQNISKRVNNYFTLPKNKSDMQNINCEGNCGGSYPICSLTHCFGCGLYKCAKEGCSNFTHLRGEREFNFHCKRGICTDFM